MSHIIDQYTQGSLGSQMIIFRAGADDMVGQSFTHDGSLIASVELYLEKVGTPTGAGYIDIYAHTGSYGTTSAATGSALITISFDIADISSENWYVFSFPIKTQKRLAAGYYVLNTRCNVGGPDDYLSISIGGGLEGHDGTYIADLYYPDDSADVHFKLHGTGAMIQQSYPMPAFARSV